MEGKDLIASFHHHQHLHQRLHDHAHMEEFLHTVVRTVVKDLTVLFQRKPHQRRDLVPQEEFHPIVVPMEEPVLTV